MLTWGQALDQATRAKFLEAVCSRERVSGLTHDFYRYPARFSPLFARAAITSFTKPNDLVVDPFMGGGTSLVEAGALGRRAIGTDVSSLATFVSQVKTTPISESDFSALYEWSKEVGGKLNLHNPPIRAVEWMEKGYQRNISGRKSWPIRKTLELILSQLYQLPEERQRRFARCVLLRTTQWALDARQQIPKAKEFRTRFFEYFSEMFIGAEEFATALENTTHLLDPHASFRTLCLHRSAIGLENESQIISCSPPKLILTSPPYPGVYALYHRWKVQGRKETPAPFWVADRLDGNGMSFYTLGNPKQHDLSTYYDQILSAFTSLSKIADHETWLVQMVGFSDPSWQLPKYLDVMEQAGFVEIQFRDFINSPDYRLWRSVPSRKWYAAYQNSTKATSKEVVLFHRLA